MRIASHRWRTVRLRQRVFAFLERKIRRERRFKQVILMATALAVLGIVQGFSWGYYLSASIDTWAGRTFRESLHLIQGRDEIEESWRRFRRASIEHTRPRVERYFADSDPAFQKLVRYAGMDPDHALLGWGNYDWTLMLSSRVFEPDSLRSYRLRPGVRSIWLRNAGARLGGAAFFLVPDGPGLSEATRGTAATPVETSRQTTNSWGLRGPEPEPDAPLRVLVLGDSFMQGMFIGDDETPPECLRRLLQRELRTRVSVLNAGLMGYSPEQYYHSMVAFADRFRPHCVVVSIFANDCGHIFDAVGRGIGDWQEGKYWLDRITRACKEQSRPSLVVPAPFKLSVLGRRNPGNYPGALANLLNIDSQAYLDPMDDFVNAHLNARNKARREARTPTGCVLFNEDLNDDHFSAIGAEVWAESVGRRLILLLEDQQLIPPGWGPGGGESRSSSAAADRARARVGMK